MAIINGKSTYGRTNLSRNRSRGVRYSSKVKRRQEPRQKKVVKTRLVRNDAYNKLNDTQKAKSQEVAKYKRANGQWVDGVSDQQKLEYNQNFVSKFKEETLENKNSISYRKPTREENMARHRANFQSSADTPQNNTLGTINRKKEFEIESDPRRQGRVRSTRPQTINSKTTIDTLRGGLKTKSGNRRPSRGGVSSDTQDLARGWSGFKGNAPTSGDFSNLSSRIRSESDKSSLKYKNDKLSAFETDWKNKFNDYASKDRLANIYNTPEFRDRYQAATAESESQKAKYESLEFAKKYLHAKRNFQSSNDGKRGKSFEHYLEKEGLDPVEAMERAKAEDVMKKYYRGGGEYKVNLGDAFGEKSEAERKLADLEKEALGILQGSFDEQYGADKNAELEALQAEIEAQTAKNSQESQYLIEDSRNQYNLQKTLFDNDSPVYDSGTADKSIFDIEKSTREFESEKQLGEYADQLRERYEKEWEQIQSRAQSAATTEERDAFLDRERRRMERVYGSEASGFTDGEMYLEQKEKADKALFDFEQGYKVDSEIESLQQAAMAFGGGAEGGVSAASIEDLQKQEKLNYIKNFMANDSGDPNTAIARAKKSYENASKMETEEEKMSEFQLGSLLDEKLARFNADQNDPESLDPTRAYEWVISQGVSMGAADKMLKMRGIDSDILEPQIERKMKSLGFRDEYIAEKLESRKFKERSEMYLEGLLDERDSAEFLREVFERAKRQEAMDLASGKSKKETKTSEESASPIAEFLAENYTIEELNEGGRTETRMNQYGNQYDKFVSVPGKISDRLAAIKILESKSMSEKMNAPFAESEDFSTEIAEVSQRIDQMPEFEMLSEEEQELAPHLASKLIHESQVADEEFKSEIIANRVMGFFGEDPQRGIEIAKEWKAKSSIGSMLEAISKQESGGNYNAEGIEIENGQFAGEKAIGKYQIMPSNWKKWAGEILGDQNAEQTPQNQEKVAKQKFLEYANWASTKSDNWEDQTRLMAVRWYGNNGEKLESVRDISDRQITINGKLQTSPKQYAENILAMRKKAIGKTRNFARKQEKVQTKSFAKASQSDKTEKQRYIDELFGD